MPPLAPPVLFHRACRRRLAAFALAALMLPAIPVLRAAAPPGGAKAEARELVRQFLRCWETGDEAAFAGLLHGNLVFAYPGGRLDRAGLMQMFADYHRQKKDIRIYPADFFISDGRQHVTAYQFAATDVATGQRFAVGTGIICRIQEGKVVLFKEYWDTEVAARQKAGELPLDEGVVAPWPASVWLRPEKIN